MFPTATYPIYADRYVPHADYIDVEGYDFTGATTKMEVRDRKNGGALRATATVTLTVTTTEGVPTTRLAWVIAEATMEAMPVDEDKEINLFYDFHLTPSGSTKFIPFEGPFVVEAGVTI